MQTSGKLMTLAQAVGAFVAPAMHLHFASTPSRSNAAVRAVCRRFHGTRPDFTLSSTGFHSTAHLFARLRLGARYIAAFFGDNYPTPRPNPLYARVRAEGAELEHWSLLSLLAAFRAGALGHPYGVTTSLLGSSLETDLARRGRLHVIPDPRDPSRQVALVAAIRPDLVFVHVPVADATGAAIAAVPHGEGSWAALAARCGIIITAERVVGPEVIARAPESVLLPPHRVIAVCHAPFGAHPQPLLAPRALDAPAHADDFAAYELFRELGLADETRAARVEALLLGDDDAYAAHFDLGRRAPAPAVPASRPREPMNAEPGPTERLVLLAARRIMQCVRADGHRVILAGIGHAFFAARAAKLLLAAEGMEVDVLVETGMYGIDCAASGPFLLGHDVISGARRLSSIEDALGAVTCGADNKCVGVVGAAQVDRFGNLNSTHLADGSLLVGSGGANDIASAAAELIVLASAEHGRLVDECHSITSPGRHVRSVVTELGVLVRQRGASTWRIEDAITPSPGDDPGQRLRGPCPWPLSHQAATLAPAFSPEERAVFAALDEVRGSRRRSQEQGA